MFFDSLVRQQEIKMIYIKILSIITLLGSIAWFIASPGFEPGLAVIGSISAIITIFLIERKKSKEESTSRSIKQQQSISKSSTGIQAGGDVIIGENRRNENAK
jgi:hypothetical protein